MKNIPIFHMSSFSRSGETLMLRCLNAHPLIHVAHQILSPDSKEDFKLFRYLQRYEEDSISSENEMVMQARVPSGSVIVVKNAVWCHQYPYKGFALVRNPFSVYRSFSIANEPVKGFMHRKAQMYRWAIGIDKNLIPGVASSSNLESFCALYNRKMQDIINSGVKIIHYENFVQNPEKYLKIICSELSLPWDSSVLKSHEFYSEGDIGHGGIKLWRPIHQGSKDSYKKVCPQDFSRIYGLTYPILNQLGYHVTDEEIMIKE
ncbi:hypothetical protein ACFO0O_06550 [Cobetia amphilecti]|uniref:Sulfotransferase n=1 Tax=Cobetia amphilecti TaxID=1055104 RepID=A0ABT6UTU9_9GAMM|nr:hypothetical protein [Cobetia amphilecti]MDI5885846.1 hypothetical protein [Cobetia amphilecti]